MVRGISLLAGVFLLLAIVAPTPPRDADAGAAEPGKINLQGRHVFGQQGKIIRALARPLAGGDPVARACWTIDEDPYPSINTVMTEVPGDPCGGATPEATLPGGDYKITVELYQPGHQTPNKQLVLQVQVAGDTYPIFDGIALSLEPPGDANCNHVIDAGDVTGILGSLAQVSSPEALCLDSANVLCTDPLDAHDALALLTHLSGAQVTIPGSCPMLLAAPVLVSPPDGTVYDIFPRTTPVNWEAVSSAASYVVETDLFGACPPYDPKAWCTDVAWSVAGVFNGITETDYSLSFVGRGMGRWRVAAVSVDGRLGPFSEWRTFKHLQ